MRTALIATICSMLISLTAALAAEEARPPKEGDAPADTLKLLTDAKPAPAERVGALVENAWIHRGIRDILGRGTEDFLQFKREGKDRLKVEKITRHYFSVNDKRVREGGKGYEETTETLDCTLTGPVLRYGDQQQTIAMTTDNRLILNAVVPLGDRTWYYAARTAWRKSDNPPFRDEEMRFKFTDDPMKQDHGKGELKIRSGDAGEVRTIPIRFTLTRTDSNGRNIDILSDDEHKANYAHLNFAPGGDCALMLNESNRSSIVYTASPAGATVRD